MQLVEAPHRHRVLHTLAERPLVTLHARIDAYWNILIDVPMKGGSDP